MTETDTQLIEEAPEKGNGEYKAPMTQAELDRIIENRLSRERAKYPGYDEYKASHEMLKQIEEAEGLMPGRNQLRLDKADAASRLAQRADVLLKEIIHESRTNQLARDKTSEAPGESRDLYQIVVNIVTTS